MSVSDGNHRFGAHLLNHVALDIGGSLAKLVFFTSNSKESGRIKEIYSYMCKDLHSTLPPQDDASSQRRQPSTILTNGNTLTFPNISVSDAISSTASIDGAICFPLEIPVQITKDGELIFHNGADTPNFDVDGTSSSESSTQPFQKGYLHFLKFETSNITTCIEFIKNALFPVGLCVIVATGGGAYKYAGLFKERLGVDIIQLDEMESLIHGLSFLLREIPEEAFTYSTNMDASVMMNLTSEEQQRWLREQPITFVPMAKDDIYPYMVVNIGSGVSIIKVTGHNTFERISGTSLGGGTFWGLLSLLTDCKSFDEMLELCVNGDNKQVDMLVGDIYDGDYPKIGLKASTIASSFGKVFRRSINTNESNIENEASSTTSAGENVENTRKTKRNRPNDEGKFTSKENKDTSISPTIVQGTPSKEKGGNHEIKISHLPIENNGCVKKTSVCTGNELFSDTTIEKDALHPEKKRRHLAKVAFDINDKKHLPSDTSDLEASDEHINSDDENYNDERLSRSERRRQLFRQEDLAKSLLYMVSNNIGQIAYLTAVQHGLKRIFFGGHFIRGHTYTMHTISFAINYWSKGTMRAYYLRHQGYLGAVGAFLSDV